MEKWQVVRVVLKNFVCDEGAAVLTGSIPS